MKLLLAAAIAAILAGCASSGVIPSERGTLMLTKLSTGCGFGSPDLLKGDLYREASEHCAAERKQFETIEFSTTPGMPFVRCASASLQFRCIAAQ